MSKIKLATEYKNAIDISIKRILNCDLSSLSYQNAQTFHDEISRVQKNIKNLLESIINNDVDLIPPLPQNALKNL